MLIYGADLSHIIELEPTALNYFNRGQWSFLNFSLSATYHPPPKEISELYPHNIYIDNASVDLLKAVELTSDRNTLSEIYGLLGFMYMERPRVLSSAPNFSKWKDKIPFELVRQDLELSIKYRQLALKVELMRQDAKNLQAGFSSIYLAAAEIAEKLGDSVAGRKFTQAAQKYRK